MLRLPPISLPKGIWLLLSLLTGFFLAGKVAGFSGDIFLTQQLGLHPAAVWRGELWRILTYVLIPSGFLDLLLSAMMIVWIGSRVARFWSTAEFLLYCAICVTGTAMGFCLMLFGSSNGIAGPSILVVCLLVARARLFGHERVRLGATFEISEMTLALGIAAVMVLFPFLSGAWLNAAVLLGAAIVSWGFLSLRWKTIRDQPARSVGSERINRLEL